MKRSPSTLSFVLICLGLHGQLGLAQFTNRYPKVEGYRHHIYLEGYELPIVASGPTDPAVSPDGRTIALASRGWLWLVDLEDRVARRLTNGSSMDSRPVWSPDASRIAFVRDDGSDTTIVEIEIESRAESTRVNTGRIDLDPRYSQNGRRLFYSSAKSGDLDIWSLDLESGRHSRITSDAGLEVAPLPLADGRLVYLAKTRGGRDELRLFDPTTSTTTVLRYQSIASQTRPALSPDSGRIVAGWPQHDSWQLWLLDVRDPHMLIQLTRDSRLPLTPAWSADGDTIYFTESDSSQNFRLYQLPTGGGVPTHVPIIEWDWGQPTGRLLIRTSRADRDGLAAARLSVVDAAGHPVMPQNTRLKFDSQSGRSYFHSPGWVELTLPAGSYRIEAAQGLECLPRTVEGSVAAGGTERIEISLRPVWEPSRDGWYSGDHHFHLNYGGQYTLRPEDLLTALRGEDIDVATPLLANLNNRFEDMKWWNWRRDNETPLVRFGQEIRSHFLGHLGLISIGELVWPWYWGPGYPSYGRLDRPNSEALNSARQQGGVSSYVHPVSVQDPLATDPPGRVPLQLIPDAILGDLDTLELACLWSDELGTSEVWFRLLNLGVAVAPSAGTDAFPNFYRSQAVGSTRVYVRPDGPLTWRSYLDGLVDGRSFVTNGPLLDFSIAGQQPGGVLPSGGPLQAELKIHSSVPVERIEILVNGRPAWSSSGLEQPGSKTYNAQIEVPQAGWVIARAVGGDTVWPAMDSYAFGQTAPIWIGRKGSIDRESAARSARDLLRLLDAADQRLHSGYGTADIPRLRDRMRLARERLQAWLLDQD